MASTVLGGTIDFLARLGVYEVVLPFLLVFTLLFAFLEKTRILGVEEVRDEKGNSHFMTRKNLNAMISFTSAFFVIASSQLVRIISEVMANTVILIVLGLCFALSAGIWHTSTDEFALEDGWKTVFYVISFLGVILILFNALGWLDAIYTFLKVSVKSSAVMSVIMVLIFIGLMAWITYSGKRSPDS